MILHFDAYVVPYWRVLAIMQLRVWAHQRSTYPLHHSRDKLFQALSHFSVLQEMESWAGPGKQARFKIGLLFNPVHNRIIVLFIRSVSPSAWSKFKQFCMYVQNKVTFRGCHNWGLHDNSMHKFP